MNIFEVNGEGKYSGGMMIIAAHDLERAVRIALYNTEPLYGIGYGGSVHDKKLNELSYSGDEEKVISKYEFSE